MIILNSKHQEVAIQTITTGYSNFIKRNNLPQYWKPQHVYHIITSCNCKTWWGFKLKQKRDAAKFAAIRGDEVDYKYLDPLFKFVDYLKKNGCYMK